jgi:hypothetical protein
LILHDVAYETLRADLVDNEYEVNSLARVLVELGYQVSQMAFDPHESEMMAARIRVGSQCLFLIWWKRSPVRPAGSSGLQFPAAAGHSVYWSRSWSMQTTVNKLATKRMLVGSGLPTPAWLEAMVPVLGIPDLATLSSRFSRMVRSQSSAVRWLVASMQLSCGL